MSRVKENVFRSDSSTGSDPDLKAYLFGVCCQSRKVEDIILRSEEFLSLEMGEIKPLSFKENYSNSGTVIKNYLFESSIQNPNKGSFKWKWIKP